MNYTDRNVKDSVMIVPRYTIVPASVVNDRIISILLKNQPSCYEIYNELIRQLGGEPLEFYTISKFAAGDMVYPDDNFCIIDFDYNSEPSGNYLDYEITVLLKIVLMNQENIDAGARLSLAYLESWLMVFQTIMPMDLIIRDRKDNESVSDYEIFKRAITKIVGNITLKSFLFQKGDEYVKGVKGTQSVLKLDIKGQAASRSH